MTSKLLASYIYTLKKIDEFRKLSEKLIILLSRPSKLLEKEDN